MEECLVRLGVNVDHVATIRQARKTIYPDPVEAAKAAIRGGADQITIHLREDRRHIQDDDLLRMRREISVSLNLEMAAAEEIVEIACRVRPDTATLVPERREELTTEGGLDVASNADVLESVVRRLSECGIAVSMFIDPDVEQVKASRNLFAKAVEFHTGSYCDASGEESAAKELSRLAEAVRFASTTDMKICGGHGLNYTNIQPVIAACPEIIEYNIGHSIVARAFMVGIEQAVREVKKILGTRNPESGI